MVAASRIWSVSYTHLEVIESRVAKAEYELGFAPKFDTVIVNDDLETAKADVYKRQGYPTIRLSTT